MFRFFRTRLARKFFRQKLAVVALAVTGGYVLLAVLVWGGLITKDEADTPVGPRHLPGFLQTPTPEERLETCETLLERIDLALQKRAAKIKQIKSAILKLPPATLNLPVKPQELFHLLLELNQQRLDLNSWLEQAGYQRLKVVDKTPAELQATLDQSWKLFEKLALNQELASDPASLTQLSELESKTAQLYELSPGTSSSTNEMHLLLGTDRQGRSIFLRAVYSIKVAMQVGLVTSLAAVIIGALLGAAAGYFGGWVDHVVIWLYTILSSIPYMVLLVVLVYAFRKTSWENTLLPLYVALTVTFWVGPCRVIRGETLKLKQLEYIQAAQALGFGRLRILLRHILPNTAHLILINFSLLFIGAIKSEVILSFLGLGVKGEPSWGIMIEQSGSEVLTGFYWQIGAATVFMFGLVLAFNILSDAIQDAYDPKHH